MGWRTRYFDDFRLNSNIISRIIRKCKSTHKIQITCNEYRVINIFVGSCTVYFMVAFWIWNMYIYRYLIIWIFIKCYNFHVVLSFLFISSITYSFLFCPLISWNVTIWFNTYHNHNEFEYYNMVSQSVDCKRDQQTGIWLWISSMQLYHKV